MTSHKASTSRSATKRIEHKRARAHDRDALHGHRSPKVVKPEAWHLRPDPPVDFDEDVDFMEEDE